MSVGEVGRCRSCSQHVRWAVSTAGRPIPLDLRPVPGGNVMLDTSTHPPVAHVVRADPGGSQYVSHFATCPAAEAHRRKPAVEDAQLTLDLL